MSIAQYIQCVPETRHSVCRRRLDPSAWCWSPGTRHNIHHRQLDPSAACRLPGTRHNVGRRRLDPSAACRLPGTRHNVGRRRLDPSAACRLPGTRHNVGRRQLDPSATAPSHTCLPENSFSGTRIRNSAWFSGTQQLAFTKMLWPSDRASHFTLRVPPFSSTTSKVLKELSFPGKKFLCALGAG